MTRESTKLRRSRFLRAAALTAALGLGLTACGGDAPQGAEGGEVGEPQSGGELTVIVDTAFAGNWPTGLDPATSNTTGSNLPQNSAIFGGLFTLETDEDGENPELVPNQAESYEWSEDGLTLTVEIREGIEFSDGTVLDADAVVWNWVRGLLSGSAGAPIIDLDLDRDLPEDLDDEFVDSVFAALPDDADEDEVMGHLAAIQAVDDYTVEMHLAEPNASLVNGMPVANLNLIGSPSAYEEMGPEQFSGAPVGAGPFVITTNNPNQLLELERNENYFKDGLPYLDELNFQSVSGDQVAYQTLQAGQGDVVEGMSDVSLIEQAENDPNVEVHLASPTSPYVVQLNARAEPFDDKRAREAIYYATDFEAINEGLFNGDGEMSQSFTASGGLFHHAEVPGYREYDPERAAEIVEEIGGLEVSLGTTDLSTARQVSTALQTQWQEAGIDVDINSHDLNDTITAFQAGEWDAMLQTAGAWDPAVGIGVAVRFGSSSDISGTPFPEGASSTQEVIEMDLQTELDELLEASVQTVDEGEREELYQEISEYIAEEAYGPFGPAFSPAQVVRTGVHGPGLTQPIPALAVNPTVLYDRVWIENP